MVCALYAQTFTYKNNNKTENVPYSSDLSHDLMPRYNLCVVAKSNSQALSCRRAIFLYISEGFIRLIFVFNLLINYLFSSGMIIQSLKRISSFNLSTFTPSKALLSKQNIRLCSRNTIMDSTSPKKIKMDHRLVWVDLEVRHRLPQ